MSPLYDLILQRKGELHTETVQVADAAHAWRVSAIPTASVALSVGMLGVMPLQLSHSHATKTKVSERSGMELRLESSALRDGIDATAQFFKTQRMVACCGDRFTLACLC